jgi:RNA polymerase sigma-70 factor (ECF subfamily)
LIVPHDAMRSDTELASQAQAGDRHAFELLVQRYKGPLYRFARRYAGTDDDAYDIVQDAFISAWLALKRYDRSKDFSTWLRAIALNKCRDLGRRQAVRRRLRGLVAFFESIRQAEQAQPDPGDDLREAERLKLLDAAIAELPSFYKEPLLLTTVGGLTQEGAAKQLGTTTKAVEMRIRRAKKRLGAALSDFMGEG